MFTYLLSMPKRLAVVGILLATSLPGFAAEEDFAKTARRALAEIHAKNFRDGNITACVSLYAGNAKFFVDNKLIASGERELLEFYKGLREVDRIKEIVVDEFVDIGSKGNVGWAIFNYTKEFDLKNRDPKFIQSHKLDGFSTLRVRQYGTAIFEKIDGHWKIQTMTVFDPEIWEPKK
jgi:ketosteroid isomerase-like protein